MSESESPAPGVGRSVSEPESSKVDGSAVTRRRSEQTVPLLLIVAGVVYLAFILLQIRGDVFYSGDGGLKFLLTRQIASGQVHVDLRLDGPEWVRGLWSDGLFPFKPPFAYVIGDRHYIQYPFYFPLLSAPAYAVLGFGGLYILPVLGLLATWLALYRLCSRARVGTIGSSAALFALIFASPLSLYGAMFWEHTLGVALAFYGVALWLEQPAAGRRRPALISGLLIGLAVWFRSELLCYAGCAVALALLGSPKGSRIGSRVPFAVGVLVAVLGLMATNLAVYHRPLGLHALNVDLGAPASVRISGAVAVLRAMLTSLFRHYPFAVAAALAGIVRMIRDHRVGDRDLRLPFLLATGALFVLLVPAILPSPALAGAGGKQWGPRFLLIVVPLSAAIVALSLRGVSVWAGRILRTGLAVLLLVTLAAGAYANMVRGVGRLREDYRSRIRPLMEAIRGNPVTAVAVTKQHFAQELAALTDRKAFLLTPGKAELEMVISAAWRNGEKRLLLVTQDGQVPRIGKTYSAPERGMAVAEVLPAGQFGKYSLFEIVLSGGPRQYGTTGSRIVTSCRPSDGAVDGMVDKPPSAIAG